MFGTMKRVTLLILLALPVLTSTASASTIAPYPGERAPDFRTKALAKFAEDFWQDRNFNADSICPEGVNVRIADDLSDDDGNALGRGTRCHVVIKARMSNNRFALRFRCKIVTHEFGHALGVTRDRLISSNGAQWDSFTQTWDSMPAYTPDGQWDIAKTVDGHTDTGVMSQGTGGIPYDCRELARDLAPKRSKRRR